jgi:hypothetical protein
MRQPMVLLSHPVAEGTARPLYAGDVDETARDGDTSQAKAWQDI